MTLNVTDFGVVADGTHDDTAGMLSARDAYQTNSDYRGGKIILPKGRIMMSQAWAFTAYATGSVHNMYVNGDGPQATVIDYTRCPAATDGISFDAGCHFGLEGFSILGAKQYGLRMDAVAGKSSAYISLKNLRIQGSAAAGLHSTNSFMMSLENIWSRDNMYGFVFEGYHTSISGKALEGSGNSQAGYYLNGMTYSSFEGCGSDANEWGYMLSNVNAVKLTACGAEDNRRDGWFVSTSDASAAGLPSGAQNVRALTMESCYSIGNATLNPSAYAQHLNVQTWNGRLADLALIGNRSIGATGKSMILSGTSGPIMTKELMNLFDAPLQISGSVSRS